VLSPRSRGLVSAADLKRMKPTSYLINTARGPIVDEAALLQTLQARKIAGAALDTYSHEPLPTDHPLRKLDNVVLTPHLGYVTADNYRRYYSEMVEDIAAWLKGEPLRRIG
jgi:phosphoglycerate dehydrogenase-like enzyme